MPYVMPSGFSTFVFGTINLLKKLSELLKKIVSIIIPISKGAEAAPKSRE